MTTKVKFVDFLPPDKPSRSNKPDAEPQAEESVEFITLPPRGVRKPKKRQKAEVPRRTCTSQFDNGTSIVRCVLPPGHHDFHQATSLNDGWWTDKQQIKGGR